MWLTDGHRDSSLGNFHCLLPKPNHPPSTPNTCRRVAQLPRSQGRNDVVTRLRSVHRFSFRYGRMTPPASTPPIHTTDISSPQLSKTGRNTSIYMKREKSRKQILCFSRPEACHRLKQLGIQGGRHGGTRSHTIAPSAADRCDRNFKALGSFEISPT